MSGLRSSVYYSLQFKLKVIDEVIQGHLSKEAASQKYGIGGHTTISKWIRKLDQRKRDNIVMESKDEKSYRDRIKELEEALDQERLRARAYGEMIKLAEKEFKIPIRKKSNTKQSNK